MIYNLYSYNLTKTFILLYNFIYIINIVLEFDELYI